MNTWQEGRQGGGNGYGGSPGGYGSEGEPNPYRAQNGGAPGESAPYPEEPTLPAGLNPRGPNAPKPLKPGQSRPAPQPVPRQADRAPLPASLNPRGPGAPAPAFTPPAPDVPAAQPGGSGGPGAPIPPGTPGAPRPPRPSNSAWPRKRKIKVGVYATLAALLLTATGTYFWADSKLNHENVLADYKGRPPAGKGTNWLIVGSDSRQGLTDAQEDSLHTGSAVGKRSDSMMLLHIGDNGNTLMSIPRDSWVNIPEHPNTNGNGKTVPATTSKINAAFNGGGGRLLVQTVEANTGLRIDHYAEIGFAGFVGLVDAVGGVEMKIDKDIKDRDSGLDLKAGTQTLTGSQALAFVRQRHQMADQDLGRMRNQQKFLAALAHQAASPGTVLNPFTFYPMVSAGLGTLIVDEDAGLGDIGSLFLAMRAVTGGDGRSITVPISNPDFRTKTGESAVKWDDAKSKQLFEAFKNDAKVPEFK
ncbi:LCP family protein [Kitasatospora albolonga]|uniref:LCP family protein n=2 Tax=Kitasatospora albolonga TaxID=68173 RepID=UPI0035E51F98